MEKNQEISEQKSSKFETQRNIDRMENDLVHLRKDIERLADEVAGLESARVDFEEKNRNINLEISQVGNQNAVTKEEINEVTSLLERERLASQNISNRLSVLNQELETWKTNLIDLVAEEARYKNIHQTATNNKDNLKKRLKSAKEEEALAEKQVTELQKKEIIATNNLDSFKQEIVALEKRIYTIREQLEEKNKSLKMAQIKSFWYFFLSSSIGIFGRKFCPENRWHRRR